MASEFETLQSIRNTANGLNPVQQTRYNELLSAGAAGNLEGIESSTGSYLDTSTSGSELARSRRYTDQAISTLQGYQPRIGEIYNTQRSVLQSQIDPTKSRYDALIADLKNQQTTSEESATLNTNREMAKRGITQSSGLSDQTLMNVINPIRRNYAGLTQQTGLAQEADIKAIQDAIKLLTGEQTGQEINLASLISQAQQGGASNALTSANALLSNAQAQNALAEQARQANATQNYQNQQLAMQQQLQPYAVTAADLANQAALAALNKSTAGGGSTNPLPATSITGGNSAFNWSQFGLGSNSSSYAPLQTSPYRNVNPYTGF